MTRIVAFSDPDYPPLLKEIHNPPKKLYVRGKLPEGLSLAVVGTRLPSAYGKQVTGQLVKPLARAGIIIVSGLAYGIDSLAHKATLEAGGKTVAVLGTGVDEQSLYPRAHLKLARKIIETDGAVISEYPEGTPGHRGHFPARNRIISGLSRGVVIVEAKKRSGALNTATHAAEQNRDVFAVPGPITAPTSATPNRLIKQGAEPLLDAQDILDFYSIETQQKTEEKTFTLSAEEQTVLDTLSSERLHKDELGRTANIPAAKLAVVLTELEMKGAVRNLGGGYYGAA